jgi:F-type H+-transporting ATPase subunit b
MSISTNLIGSLLAAEEHDPAKSIHWLWPEQAELIYGSIASLLIFGLLWKFAGPAVKQAMSDRTAAIQENLDNAETAKTEAEAEAAGIRQAAGDIDAERQRLFAEADAQAEALLIEGRARLEHEVAELHARADADIVATAGRATDELRFEISHLANSVTENVLAGGVIDDVTHQELIEAYISKVGMS